MEPSGTSKKLTRRELMYLAQALGLGGWLVAQKGLSRGWSPAAFRNSSAAEWLKAISPIQEHRALPPSGWLGDGSMGFAHDSIRDRELELPSSAPTIRTRLAIVGGGMSGLGAAYLLRRYKPMIFDQAPSLGGNAKGETWQGVSYSLGAAYVVNLPETHPVSREFFAPLNVAKYWRQVGKEWFEEEGNLTLSPWQDELERFPPALKKQVQILREFFAEVAEHQYPEIPPAHGSTLSEQVLEWDRYSFLELLEQKVGGALDPYLRTIFELYCWSSFGGSCAELSAAAGLNFYVGDLSEVCAFPGGNSRFAQLMTEQLVAAGMGEEHYKTNTIVFKVLPRDGEVELHCRHRDGSFTKVIAESCVLACPKFVAKNIVAGVPAEQLGAMKKMTYRAVAVVNVLLSEVISQDAYDVYLLRRKNLDFSDIAQAAGQHVITDVILGHWAQSAGGPPEKSVLTLHCPLPWNEGRFGIVTEEARQALLARVRQQLENEILPLFHVAKSKIEEVRPAFWGHPMPLSRHGFYRSGTFAKASEDISKRLYFCNQDNWGLPSLEVCLSEAIKVAEKVETVLA